MMKEENIKEKKKQKAPLGIRPDDYIDIKFREHVEKEGISQTKLFDRMFCEFTRNSKDALKLQALDCSVELQSISGASATLVKAIEKIVSIAFPCVSISLSLYIFCGNKSIILTGNSYIIPL